MNTASPADSELSSATARFCGGFEIIPSVSHRGSSGSCTYAGATIDSGATNSCESNPTPKSRVAMAASTDRLAWYRALLNDGVIVPSFPVCSKVRVTTSTM